MPETYLPVPESDETEEWGDREERFGAPEPMILDHKPLPDTEDDR